MRKTFGSILGLAVLIFICTSGLVEPVTKVFIWLITLQYNSPDISKPDEFWDDLRKLKETVRCSLNKAVGNSFFSDGKDELAQDYLG